MLLCIGAVSYTHLTSAVCVTGLVVKDSGSYWSVFGQTVIPVSYTHLDVYKRQRMLTAQKIPTPGTLEYRRTGSTRRYHPGYECKWATNTVAVSYTHLDVYKRQIYSIPYIWN